MASHIVSRASRLSFLLLVLGATVETARAQSDATGSYFVFPHFVTGGSVGSGIALFNPRPSESTVTMTLTDIDGRVVSGLVRPAIITIPAGGQVAMIASELFGTLDFDATLLVASTTPGLVAYYQTFDAAGTFSDGADQPQAGTTVAFPVAPSSAEGRAEIDLVNPNQRSTGVELKLWSLNGDLLGKASVQLAAGGAYRSTADALFPGASFSGASHITAAGKPVNLFAQAQSVAGTSVLVPGRGDIAALNALALTQASNSGVIAHFRTGQERTAVLSIANMEPAASDVTVTAVAANGSTVAARKLSIKSNGGFRGPLEGLFPSFAAEEREGWLLIQSSGRVVAVLMYGGPGGRSLSAFPMQKTPSVDFVFPQLVEGTYGSTELSMANPGPNTSYADIYAVAPSGVTLGSTQVTMKPGEVFARNLREILPEVSEQVGGAVYVHANEPLFAISSIAGTDGVTVSSFTPQPLSVAYRPAAQKMFAATGKITLNNRPAPGFRVALTGSVSKIATSAADGTYAFTQLPAGHYSLAVDQFGFQFVPGQVVFDITDASKRQDFQGYTSERGIVVQPGSLPVESPDTTVSIFGTGFDNTSQAYAGAVRLETTFLGPNQLTVVVPAHMLAVPNRFEVFVVTAENGPQRSQTDSFPFVAFQDRPVLDSILTPGQIAEGNGATTMTLKGSGFLEGARVRINGTSDGIGTTLVDSGQMIADVPAEYFRHGGIFPVTVENPYPASIESNVQLLTVYYPSPTVEQVSPAVIPVKLEPGDGAVTIEIMGWGFRRGAVAYFNGEPLVTTYCENDPYCLSVHLYAKVPPSLLQRSGFARVWVRNPDPCLASSESVFVKVDALQPTITSVLAGSATALSTPFTFSMPVVVNGTNFGPQTTIRIYRADSEDIPEFASSGVKVLSSTQLYAAIQISYETGLGEWKVEVANPQPGGGQSEAVSFFISEGNFAANPFLVSLNPEMVPAGGPSFTLTVNGTNLGNGCRIRFQTTFLPTVFVSQYQVRAEVPAYLIQNAGRVPVSVTSTDNGGTSNRLFLDIR